MCILQHWRNLACLYVISSKGDLTAPHESQGQSLENISTHQEVQAHQALPSSSRAFWELFWLPRSSSSSSTDSCPGEGAPVSSEGSPVPGGTLGAASAKNLMTREASAALSA